MRKQLSTTRLPINQEVFYFAAEIAIAILLLSIH